MTPEDIKAAMKDIEYEKKTSTCCSCSTLRELIRKKDEALKKIYKTALDRIPDRREYDLCDLAREALGSELE